MTRLSLNRRTLPRAGDWLVAEAIEILIAGGHGQVGRALACAPWPEGVRLHRPSRPELDLTSEAALSDAFARRPFAAVINAAAFTAVDAAEDQAGEAFLANALIPARLADRCRASDAVLIQLSTDCVFDGLKGQPYLEEDAPSPVGVYGASKRAGELAALSGAPRAAVVRTAWVVSARGSNFVRRILELAEADGALPVIADRRGSPTSADDLAMALVDLTLAMVAEPKAPGGVYHCVNGGDASWAEMASEAVRLMGSRGVVRPIPASDRPARAPRPVDARLSCERLARNYGIRMRHWREALVEIVAELKAERTS